MLVGLLMPIGDRVKELRMAKGMTQLELSRATNLSLSIITQMEQGLTSDPKLSTLRALAKALEVTIDELVGEEDEPGPEPKKPTRKRK